MIDSDPFHGRYREFLNHDAEWSNESQHDQPKPRAYGQPKYCERLVDSR